MVRFFALVLAGVMFAAPSLAQDVISTAKGAPPPPEAAAAPAPLDAAKHPDGVERQVVRIGPCTPYAEEIRQEAQAEGADIQPDRSMHGQVEAGIGTHDYREGRATVCHPLGEHGALTISVGGEKIEGGRRH